jgi:hypothetical protein
MLQAMTVILTAVSCVICAVPFGQWACGFCTAGTNFAPKLQQAITKYQKVVEKVLPPMSHLQRVVAWTTPYVALVKSQGMTNEYAPAVTQGVMLSPSMVPCSPGGCEGKLGLPVQEDSYANLCSKAGEYTAEVAFFWMDGPLGILKAGLEKFAGWLTGSFPGYFCGAGGVQIGDGTASIEQIAKKACEETEKGKKKEHEDQHGNLDSFSFDMKQCKEDKQKEFKGKVDAELGQNASNTFSGTMSADKMRHKKIYEGAEHGGFYFQVFGLAMADQSWPRRTDKGILIATKTGAMSVPTNMFTAMRFAQAEFFFDKSGSWNNNADQAMWELAWRARLRRVRPMAPNVANFAFTQALGKLQEVIGTQLTQQLKDGDVFDFLVGQAGFDAAAGWIKNQAGKLGAQIDHQIDAKLQISSWEVVH